MESFKITRVSVLVGLHGTDKVNLYLDSPTPFPKMGYEACAVVDAAKGYGVTWVKENISAGIPVEIIDCSGNKNA